MTVGEFLTPPFQSVRVLRALGTYGRMLRLEPTVSMAPDPEFLVRLITGHSSHQAYIRHEAGDNAYKNLENLIRGKHNVSQTTKRMLVDLLGVSVDYLEGLIGSAPKGALMPDFLNFFKIVEGVTRLITTGALNCEVSCPCCGKNILDDVDVWWEQLAPGMAPAEYHFAERLLRAISGASLIERLVAPILGWSELSLGRLASLANPLRHPIGNWLLEVQIAMSSSSLAELAIALQLQGDIGATLSHGRLKKWSSGQDVLPLETGKAIVKACWRPTSGVQRLIAARTIALITDFVAASWPTSIHNNGRKDAQAIVHARLEQLARNLQVADYHRTVSNLLAVIEQNKK